MIFPPFKHQNFWLTSINFDICSLLTALDDHYSMPICTQVNIRVMIITSGVYEAIDEIHRPHVHIINSIKTDQPMCVGANCQNITHSDLAKFSYPPFAVIWLMIILLRCLWTNSMITFNSTCYVTSNFWMISILKMQRIMLCMPWQLNLFVFLHRLFRVHADAVMYFVYFVFILHCKWCPMNQDLLWIYCWEVFFFEAL